MRFLHRRRGRLVFTGVMLLSWSGALPTMAQAPKPQPKGAAAGTGDELSPRARQALEMIRRLCDVTEARLGKPGADPADVAARAAQLGHDPAKVFAFVRDEIAYEPYRGSLRGAVGALVGRSANAMDKSALLAAMLRAGGREARVVTGRLAPDKAQALVSQFLARDPLKGALGRYADTTSVDQAALQELARQAGFTPEQVKPWIERSRKQYATLKQETFDTTEATHAYLAGLVKQHNVALGRPADAWQTELADRAADHAWVQVKDPAGSFVDYDPSFADAQPGTHHAQGTPLEKIDAASRHRVQFQLVYSFADGSESKTETLIDQAIYADEAWADAPQFRIAPSDPLPSFDDTSANAKSALELMKKIKKYQPVLRLGRKYVAGKPFDLEGNTFDVEPGNGRVKGAMALGGATGGLFGGGLGAGDAKPSKKFVELSVLMTVHAPGAAPRPQRRTLLTAADTQGNHLLSPILGWEMLLQGQVISAEAAEFAAARKQLSTWRPAVAVFGKGSIAKGDLQRLAAIDPDPYPDFLVTFAQLRQAAIAERLAKSPGVVPLIDGPQLVISERRFCMNMTSGHACDRSAIDIVENGITFVPTKADASGAAAVAAMWQGVFDTVAEAALLQGQTSLPVGSAVVAAERGRIRKAGGLFAGPDGVDRLPAGALPEAERNWIKRYEPKSRQILVVDAAGDADAPTIPTWWTLEPQTGAILGRSVGGRGAALSEDAITTVNYGICLITVMYDFGRNVQKNGATVKGGVKSAAGLVGCFAGFTAGILKPSPAWQIGQNLFSMAIGVFGTELDVSG
jgi:transglutaminase-like putative cysteine protease